MESPPPGLAPDDFILLFEQAPGPYLVLAPDAPRFTIVGVNAAYERATRTRREALISRGIFECFPDSPDETTGVRNLRASLERALASRLPDIMPTQHYPIPLPEGGFEDRHWSPINTPVLDGAGRVRFLLHHVEDVTQVVHLRREGEADRGALGALREAERERGELLAQERRRRTRAEEARRQLYTAFEHAPVGIAFFHGPRHVIEYANPYEATTVWGRTPEAVVGRPLAEALPEVAAQGIIERFCDPVYRAGKTMTLTELAIRFEKGGKLEEGFFNVVHVPLGDESGGVEGFMAVAWDVTEAVRARERALSLSDQLQVRADFERQLLGIVSHDLRNPLGAIQLASVAMARREHLDAQDARSILRIQSSVERAIHLVQDLLDFTRARIGSGIPLQRAQTDLHAVTADVLQEVEAAHPGRIIQLRGRGDARGVWDAARVGQIVQNLVTNALQYSPEDSVVHVSTNGEDGVVRLSIHNSGAPIPSEALGRMFEPLQRGASETDSSRRSLGLGLYIVKHLVDAHGGRVEVTSTVEGGTDFVVTLPRRSESR